MAFKNIKQLLNNHRHDVTVSSEEYQQFRREYVMSYGLRGESFANAFCQRFGIVDYHMIGMDSDEADRYIDKVYLDQKRNTYQYHDI